MRSSSAAAYAIGASLSACAGAAALLAWAPSPAWLLAGAAATAVPGVVAGAGLARAHGRPGPRFVVVFGAGVAARLLLAAVAAFGAAQAGPEAEAAALAGLAAGFVPVTVFEMVWFSRAAARLAAGAGAGRRG